MADMIKLTPEELQAQAAEMKALEKEYTSLFSNVSSELGKVNSNWSPNLANNFTGKIRSAQNRFMYITEELNNGAKVADSCAITFQSVDSELAKIYSTDTGVLPKAVSGGEPTQAKESILMEYVGNLAATGEVFAWLENWYAENVSTEQQVYYDLAFDLFEEVVEGTNGEELIKEWKTIKQAYSFVSDLAQGELEPDSVLDLGKAIAKGKNAYLYTGFDAVSYVLDKGAARVDELEAEMLEQIKEGDVLGTVIDGAEGLIDTIIGGATECIFNLAGAEVDSAIGKLPVLGSAINASSKLITNELFGEAMSIGDCVKEVGQGLSDGIDWTTDVLTAATDIVTDGITNGVKGICSYIGKLCK